MIEVKRGVSKTEFEDSYQVKVICINCREQGWYYISRGVLVSDSMCAECATQSLQTDKT